MTPPRPLPLNPKKLLDSKWTAVNPTGKEKHFVVTRIIRPDAPRSPVVSVELQAVLTKRSRVVEWPELADSERWRPGWV